MYIRQRKTYILLLVFAIVIFSVAVTGNTLAKYASGTSAADSARVAKFSVTAPGITSGTVDLFRTVMDSNGTAENDVISPQADENPKIAPGTQGSFNIEVDFDTEVACNYSFSASEINGNNIPVIYSCDGGKSWYPAAQIGDAVSGNVSPGVHKVVNTIKWKWAYEGGEGQTDEKDTVLGFDSAATVVVNLSCTVNQLN